MVVIVSEWMSFPCVLVEPWKSNVILKVITAPSEKFVVALPFLFVSSVLDQRLHTSYLLCNAKQICTLQSPVFLKKCYPVMFALLENDLFHIMPLSSFTCKFYFWNWWLSFCISGGFPQCYPWLYCRVLLQYWLRRPCLLCVIIQ